ncbi:PDZ domain-containing protein [Streptomyces beihaiensis]|uniref:PDZ domain-containing protein n=1 Tax=Streptomyces beihaiensis TaxID=2984495 RepID=A0ABT3U0B0_9ACTN|nr:PDZ domain-containing protein [Streptomyces beihaiensis]MCX3062748.1 PDZ domain-containing protein [Streptomyces beihaiensis]
MEQTALRPKSLPGAPDPDPGGGPGGPAGSAPARGPARRRPHAARRRGKRLVSTVLGVGCALVLVLAGVGLGTVGATVIGMSRLAALQKARQQANAGPGQRPGSHSAGSTAPKPGPATTPPPASPPAIAAARVSLGVEAVDAPGDGGALVVAVHVPGPGYTAGLVRGDVLLDLGGTRIGSAKDLAAAVAAAHPGSPLALTVRHSGGGRQQLSALPGVIT